MVAVIALVVSGISAYVAHKARGEAKRSADAAEKSAEAQAEANRLTEQHRAEDQAKATAAQHAATQEAMRRATMVRPKIGADGVILQITNRSERTVSGLRVVQVTDLDTDRRPPARPRRTDRPETTGQLRQGESAAYALDYLNSAPPGGPASTRQAADGPWMVTYRLTDGDGQRWQVDASVTKGGTVAPIIARPVLIDDIDLIEEVEE